MTEDDLLQAALSDRWLRWPSDRALIRTAEKVWIAGDAGPVGFLIVRLSRGYTRLGPFFVHPDYRRQGWMQQAYRAYLDKPLLAWVEDGNTASLALHRKLGFVAWFRAGYGTFFRRFP